VQTHSVRPPSLRTVSILFYDGSACSGRGGEGGLTCYLECDGYALRTLYVYDRDIHEVLQSLRHVVWVRGTEILVVLEPRDKG
jgi:hypothetical protein